MNEKKFYLLISPIACLLLLFNPLLINGVDLTLTDETSDISHWVDGVEVATNLADPAEIDIISMEMNETIVAVTFVDTPVLSIDNWYVLYTFDGGEPGIGKDKFQYIRRVPGSGMNFDREHAIDYVKAGVAPGAPRDIEEGNIQVHVYD